MEAARSKCGLICRPSARRNNCTDTENALLALIYQREYAVGLFSVAFEIICYLCFRADECLYSELYCNFVTHTVGSLGIRLLEHIDGVLKTCCLFL